MQMKMSPLWIGKTNEKKLTWDLLQNSSALVWYCDGQYTGTSVKVKWNMTLPTLTGKTVLALYFGRTSLLKTFRNSKVYKLLQFWVVISIISSNRILQSRRMYIWQQQRIYNLMVTTQSWEKSLSLNNQFHYTHTQPTPSHLAFWQAFGCLAKLYVINSYSSWLLLSQ